MKTIFDERVTVSHIRKPIPQTFEQAVEQVVDGMLRVLYAKRAQRGTENIQKQGLDGVVNRLVHDKGERVLRYNRRVQARELVREFLPPDVLNQYLPAPSDEERASVFDDLLDVGNYAIIAQCLELNWWSLPSSGEYGDRLLTDEEKDRLRLDDSGEGDVREED